jgi:hypothetical protein
MKNDDEHALSILRVIARMNPSDENTKEELKRLEEKVLRVKLEKLHRVVATADNAAIEAELAHIENSGVPVPPSHPVWQEAQVARCQDMLRRAEQLRQQDAWQDAEVLAEEIHTLATHYNLQLPAADADAWNLLDEWTTGKRSAYANDQDFQRALSSLEYEVQTLESRRANASRLTAIDAKNSFNSLAAKWSESERYNRPLGEALIGRCEQIRLWLQNSMNAAARRKRLGAIAVTLLVLAAIAATIPFVLDWAKERNLLLRFNILESSRHVADTENLIAQVPARLKAKSNVTEAMTKAHRFILHEKELKGVFDENLRGLQQSAAGNFSGGIENVGVRRAQADRELAQLAPEFQANSKLALSGWDNQWQSVRSTTLSNLLDRADQIAVALNGTNGFHVVHDALLQIQSMLAGMVQLTNEPPALDRNLAARLRELAAKSALWAQHADQWEKANGALTDAQSLDQYLDRLDSLVQSPFASATQRDSVTEIDRLKINRETLLGELLLPNNPTLWSSLTNVTEWRTTLMPEQPTVQEKDLYLKLRDDKNMQNVFVYQLITNARPNNPFKDHPVFVQGSIERDRGGAMAGMVFDPSATRDLLRFAPKRYSDWDWDYARIKNLFRTQECETFERIGLGELINPNTGNYQKPVLQLFDQLDQETNSSALFRAFVTLKLFALAGLRPEEWGLQWSPDTARHIQRLNDLGAFSLKSGDWMVPDQSAKYEASLQTCFARVRGLSLEKEARLLQQLARETCQTDFSYAGFVDGTGQAVLRQIVPPVPEYWGWGSNSRSTVLLVRKTAAGPSFVASPMPYTPLFIFNGDRQRLLHEIGHSLSYPPSQTAGILPPFFAGLPYE